MKLWLPGLLFILLLSQCRPPGPLEEVTYLKVFTMTRADTANLYNRDHGVGFFLYYSKDSTIYRQEGGPAGKLFETYSGVLDNDSFESAFNDFSHYVRLLPNKGIPDNHNEGDTYCGPVLYTEFGTKAGVRFFDFIMNGNDTVDRFVQSFFELSQKPWKDRRLIADVVNSDFEIAQAFKRLKIYDSLALSPEMIPLINAEKRRMDSIYRAEGE